MKTVADIRNEIINYPAKTKWEEGVREYALDLFDDVIEARGLRDDDELKEKIIDKEMKNGAVSWGEYSYGGCALVYDFDICKRLYGEEFWDKKWLYRHKPPHFRDYLAAQGSGLVQAAKIVRKLTRE